MIGIGINIHPKNPTLTAKVGRIMKEVVGAWYDPLLSYLYTTSTGATAVTTAEDPVGLTIDRRLGAGLGAELVTNGTFDTNIDGWTPQGVATAVWQSGAIFVDRNGDASFNNVLQNAPIIATIGKAYRITYELKSVSVAASITFGGAATPIVTTVGTHTAIVIATITTDDIYLNCRNSTAATATFDNISIKLLDGNHALQATAAARPTYRVDAGGRPYVAFLGTDDNMTSATGGGGSAGFFYCAAIKPTGGAGTVRRLFDDRVIASNTGYVTTLNSLNLFTLNAGNGTAYTQVTGTAGTVGSSYVVMFWDDGTNLNAQVNNGAVASIARPVVVAGTAGFTLGKDNGAALNFLIADVYAQVYAKNTGLTASQRATIQKYVAASAGITL